MNLTQIAEREQSLRGEIKQADADVSEAKLHLHRAEQALERAKLDLEGAEQRAAEKRTERDDLAKLAHAQISQCGEPAPAQAEEASGEEVIQSSSGEGPSPDHAFIPLADDDAAVLARIDGALTAPARHEGESRPNGAW